ncbi:MAG: septum formation inhibitor Maf [Gammaproteobacteria bacterium]|nr:septum formation inhibitor Maf [Gammaproteobacteria bacterium]
MIFLASRSPRRQDLLRQIHVDFELVDVDVPEVPIEGEKPSDFVLRLARAKARVGFQQLQLQDALVLAADTAVVIDRIILGKPRDRNEGLAMLGRLSGRTHQVFSAVALVSAVAESADLSVSEVTFREISTEERELYWDSGEPADKAGAYAIQGIAAIFIKQLSGSYSGVMGLPLYETGRLLAAR